jgi:hypothetical protein
LTFAQALEDKTGLMLFIMPYAGFVNEASPVVIRKRENKSSSGNHKLILHCFY